MSGLTPRQRDVYEFIGDWWAQYDHCPSYEQIQEGLGYASKSPVHLHVTALERRGYLRRTPHTARSLEIIPRDDLFFQRGYEEALAAVLSAEAAGYSLCKKGRSYYLRKRFSDKSCAGPFDTPDRALNFVARLVAQEGSNAR